MNALSTQIVSFLATDGPCTAREVLQQFPELEDTAAALRTLKLLVTERKLEQRTPEVGNLAFAIPESRNGPSVADEPSPARSVASTAPEKQATASSAAVVAERVRDATLAFLANQPTGANAADMRQLFEREGVASNLGYKCLDPLIRNGRIVSSGKTRSLQLRLSTVDAGAPPKASAVANATQGDEAHDYDRKLDATERELIEKLVRAAKSSSDSNIRILAFSIEGVRNEKSKHRTVSKPRAKGTRAKPGRKANKKTKATRRKPAKRRPRKR